MHNFTNPELSISIRMQNFIKFPSFSLEILSGYENLKQVKGQNRLINLHILPQNNPNLDLINIKVYAKSC